MGREMKKLASLFCLIAIPALAPATSLFTANLTQGYVSHSAFWLGWNTSGAFNAAKISFAPDPLACDDPSAMVQVNTQNLVSFPVGQKYSVGGMNADTVYNVCP